MKSAEAAARKWDTYWSEAERAGLKAMGRLLDGCGGFVKMGFWEYYDEIAFVIYAIRAYVEAARKVKEGK